MDNNYPLSSINPMHLGLDEVVEAFHFQYSVGTMVSTICPLLLLASRESPCCCNVCWRMSELLCNMSNVSEAANFFAAPFLGFIYIIYIFSMVFYTENVA